MSEEGFGVEVSVSITSGYAETRGHMQFAFPLDGDPKYVAETLSAGMGRIVEKLTEARLPDGGWLPMSEAPRDSDTKILLLTIGAMTPVVRLAWWENGEPAYEGQPADEVMERGWWSDRNSVGFEHLDMAEEEYVPTFWMPMPTPPTRMVDSAADPEKWAALWKQEPYPPGSREEADEKERLRRAEEDARRRHEQEQRR